MAITPPRTEIEIISQAALLVGRHSFSSLDEGGAFAQDADALFNTIVSAELGSNRWRFAQASQEVSTLTTLSPTFDGWEFYWDLPSDLLVLFYTDPMINYTVFGNRLLTSSDQTFTAVYSKNVPVSKWPPSFSMYIVLQLAAMLAKSVTNSDRMVQRIQSDMELWHSRALFSDGQNSRPKAIRSNPYIDVRYKTNTQRAR